MYRARSPAPHRRKAIQATKTATLVFLCIVGDGVPIRESRMVANIVTAEFVLICLAIRKFDRLYRDFFAAPLLFGAHG